MLDVMDALNNIFVPCRLGKICEEAGEGEGEADAQGLAIISDWFVGLNQNIYRYG